MLTKPIVCLNVYKFINYIDKNKQKFIKKLFFFYNFAILKNKYDINIEGKVIFNKLFEKVFAFAIFNLIDL